MQKQLMNHVCILTILKIYIHKTNMVTLSKYMTKLTVLEGKTSFFKTKIVNFAISSLDKAQHISEPMITTSMEYFFSNQNQVKPAVNNHI